jgi:hypothetical protein
MKTLFDDKIKQASLGDATYNQAHGESQFLEESIAFVELELRDLEKDQSAISKQLVEMQNGGRLSFWPKLILHLNRPINDRTSMIIIKACGLCGQWYHCGDIVVTSYLHTFHSTCFGEHLKTNNKCKTYAIRDYTLISGVVGASNLLMMMKLGLQHVRWVLKKNKFSYGMNSKS